MEDDKVIINLLEKYYFSLNELRLLCDHFWDRVDVDHKDLLLVPVLEFMPGTCGDDHNAIFAKRFGLAVNNRFDLSLENDKCLFVGVAMFPGTFARGRSER
jgi:hypothetical protein